MRVLYIFPHPDDESFGPAPVIAKQIREGHEVFLFTLTKGGATKLRHKFGYSIEEMGEVRYKEMLEVEKVLNLSGMKVIDLPDSGLKELDPRIIEEIIEVEIKRIKPDTVVTYAVHGISGFHDHLVSHAVVKRVYVKLKSENVDYLKRLAFFTLNEEQATSSNSIHKLNFSKDEEIDCIITVDQEDIALFKKALDCYVTYKEMIELSKIKESVKDKIVFEFFRESFIPPVNDMFYGL